MKGSKKVMNVKGFTLIEVLIAFTCVLIAILLCMPIISSIAYMQKPSYLSEDRIAIYQLRLLLAQSNDISIKDESLYFLYQKEPQVLQYDRNRLVRKKGYEIFMQSVDDLYFEQREECFYVVWQREKKQKTALLACN
ncbi:prepilin-type N-terminal cleavage/methylation domain-containing protein [Erysipelotrichaceae bacterium HCN-30851]